MKILGIGSVGPEVELLQLALRRVGFALATDGVFGEGTRGALMAFQREQGLTPDGVAGASTQRALLPWYTGFLIHRIRAGDTLFRLAVEYGGAVGAIETANPGIDYRNLQVGQSLVIPLGFPVVPTEIGYSGALISYIVRGLFARYPFLRVGVIGRSVLGQPVWALNFGAGENRVLYNASHHANEWITTPVLLKFLEELAEAYAAGGSV
ncbi:MAG: peptidoglycan-binding protein, partial [Firmicutes bacterium]|nr:peptidoglycan-binding protein [Bacillota bacterium]